ncbi:hypothetical protein GN958_ATG23571 [Phytophthora infestans]|uniref:DDE Tnp4 domain-containing protein n=1 Tax=Phytophthora infestans TaxID=4787 RepID=A0A8S9TMM9_PHYIN|nr:hypothetical protein GN958_ATG23571 [Phytophthora infestans]
MANLHMLYVMLIKLREDLQGSSGHRPCARIPRLSSTPAEAERPFNQNYCNIHPKVFRGAYRINHPELESLFHCTANLICMPSDVCPEFALRFPHFNQALCAIDGVHFLVGVAEEGVTTTNVLIASGWNLRVAFVNAGMEGSSHYYSVLSFSGFLTKILTYYYIFQMQDMRLRHKFLHLIEVYDITF